MHTKPRVAENGRLAGTRISVWDVLHYVERGRSFEEIAACLPIDRDEFNAVMEYIAANREAVYRVHREIEERNRRGNSPEVEAKLAESRRRVREWMQSRQSGRMPQADSSPKDAA